MIWMFWAFVFLFGPMILVLGVMSVLARLYQCAPKRSPLRRALLRSPGESLRAQIQELDLDIMGYFAFALMIPGVIYSFYLASPASAHGVAARAAVSIAGAGIGVLYTLYKLVRAVMRRRNLRLGYDAELAMGQELNQLLRDQYWVFHDVPFDRFNIDHIVVGRTGVFAMETKGRAKPIGKDGKAKWEVEYDGKRLQFPGWTEMAPLEQAQRQADNLRQWLSSAVGESVSVTPVLALPGWYIKRTARGPVAVINGTNPGAYFRKAGDANLSEQMVTRIVHQLDQKCRDVEPRAYGKAKQKQEA